MAVIEPRVFDELKKALTSFGDKYFIGNVLNRAKVADDLRAYDEALLTKLLQIDFIKENYVKQVAGQKLFQIDRLEEAVLYDDYWDTSYTKYENRVGLTTGGRYLEDSQDVVLDFPFKDSVLAASMTKEDSENGYNDTFLNEIIEKDEIDSMLDRKILVNMKRYGDAKQGDQNVRDISINTSTDNLIIKGNNLLALHILAGNYTGRVKLIYIDPPYNTGSDSFAYNDKFNHSTWLTFMKNRLEAAKNLLTEAGSIWINIDQHEAHYLKVIADEIFPNGFVADIAWQKRTSPDSRNPLGDAFDHILVFANDVALFKQTLNHLPLRDDQISNYKNPDEDPHGPWTSTDFTAQGYRPNQMYKITAPSGRELTPPQGRCWRTLESEYNKLLQSGRMWFGKDGDSVPRQKTYLKERKGATAWTWWPNSEVGNNQDAKKESLALFGEGVFATPKPEKLLKRIITLASDESDIVLDFFMGSATTQAVAMKMNRRFIGIEQMDYINTVSVPRLQKVIAGEQGGISKDVDWQGGGSFVYAELFPKNMGYLQDIIASKSMDELQSVYDRMLTGVEGSMAPADISFRADLSKIEWNPSKVKFDDQKRLLVKLLDKNGLYYNYSEIDDADVREFLSDEDYHFNKSFYGDGE